MKNKKVVRFITVLLIASMCIVNTSVLAAVRVTDIYYGSAPIRSIIRCSNGRLIGARTAGHEIEVWSSSNNGSSWTRYGAVVSNNSINFADPNLLAIAGTNTVFIAFTEINSGKHWITICRSDNNGKSWVYDSTVVGNTSRFVGAPFLFRADNGDLQCYYDSEELAEVNGRPGHQWIAMQGRNGISGSWNKYGVVTVSREANSALLTRDGMATVVNLGNNRLMCVTEGVETYATGGSHANVIRAIQSWDGGMTWDYNNRQIVYQSRIDAGSGRRYNAYAPYAIRIGGGPVGVVFCTDEDFQGPPAYSNQDVLTRRAHVKYIQTTNTFENWGSVTTIWAAGDKAYVPGLYERWSNNVLVTIDNFHGNQTILQLTP
ncbi:phage capsid protein [Clostridium thermarum]|uniref:phage capsid protein n=1 Tax=Clostridium thermarum TaxID=1716543 RepID=UPI0013CF8D63|nr:phage capsid protein [Clostridium thermarum]